MIFFESRVDFRSQKEQSNITSTTPLGYEQNKRINKDISKGIVFALWRADFTQRGEAGTLAKLCRGSLLLPIAYIA